MKKTCKGFIFGVAVTVIIAIVAIIRLLGKVFGDSHVGEDVVIPKTKEGISEVIRYLLYGPRQKYCSYYHRYNYNRIYDGKEDDL